MTGAELRRRRERMGWTQAELAEKVGVHANSIARQERGEMEALARWQATAEAEALMEGRDVSPWVFPSEAGTPLDLSAVAKRFKALLRAAQVPRHHSLYDLRNSYASHLLADAAPITYVAAQLGHRKPTTTLAFYAHWIPRGDKHWAGRSTRGRAPGGGTWHQDLAPSGLDRGG
jgi:integrase